MFKDILLKLFGRFFPKEEAVSPYRVNFKSYYNAGYRAVFFDIDNTLVPYDAPADDKAKELFKELKEMGFKTCLISNNNKKRTATFAKDVDSSFTYKSKKPAPDAYIRAAGHLGVRVNQVLFFGDQLFTDIWGANNAGMYPILVERIGEDVLLQIKLKRYLEKPVYAAYEYVKKN